MSGRGRLKREVVANYGHADTDHYFQLVEAAIDYRQRFLDAFAGFDVVVSPATALPAFRHGAAEELVLGGAYTCLYNVLGWPAGVVPVTRVRAGEESDRPASKDAMDRAARETERGSAGLPIGVQVAARPWREDLVLAALRAIEARRQRHMIGPLSSAARACGGSVAAAPSRRTACRCAGCRRSAGSRSASGRNAPPVMNAKRGAISGSVMRTCSYERHAGLARHHQIAQHDVEVLAGCDQLARFGGADHRHHVVLVGQRHRHRLRHRAARRRSRARGRGGGARRRTASAWTSAAAASRRVYAHSVTVTTLPSPSTLSMRMSPPAALTMP